MTCREFVEFLNTYLDGNLTPAERAEFERHLAICPQCVSYLAGYQRTIKLTREAIADTPDVAKDAPEELVAAILAAKRQQS